MKEQMLNLVRDILRYDWNPIGVDDEIALRDEYERYVGEIYRMISDGGTIDELAQYLNDIVTREMGLIPDMELNERVAKKLKSLA
ncbi:hypothetical protein DC522_33030 [Microvirga sp. KLBC 81]|uniref:hypothetical protein n=1 Tax=Microvirga sp. KLBC 81 TaxID=1862707 RepID=UPI000D51A9AD|nr:hypothetical protein [Microvirga sp. KLBC 81]PVE20319.1 hypothetical protein DC522_33030 [Microvirga sp. KLBC 81]